ncbi:MAG: nondiscriminating glutamyl-tRNA synthetase [Parcubacteria group bacterium Gr01-1014_2]|nr:MAG: nondiscriminating glutamyl-tRNA synthetase [Parcubacteria group bacterium Gr01-1014_2]
MSNEIRVRIAPSPTGPLHIGTARTALFNWLFARKNGGIFVLRIEDTDLERSSPKFEEDIKDSLDWLNLEWDEFYRQSERLDIYKKHLQKLLDEDKAFWCYHSVEELETEKKEQMKKKEAPRHVCEHKFQVSSFKFQNKNGIIRLKVNENSTRTIHFNDIIRGTVEWQEKLIGDLSLAKDLDTPLYNFAVVVDDHETKISHVIRGEDHISNTPKQILIQEALGIKPLWYAHLPLILGPDRTKLSKRHGATAIGEYREDGYLTEALVNFMALLGWRPNKNPKSKIQNPNDQNKKPEDIYYIDELISSFDLKNVQKSPAVFDIKKLNWMSGYYIHQLPPEQFRAAIMPFIIKELGVNDIHPVKSAKGGVAKQQFNWVKDDYLDKIQHLMTERMEKLSDIKNFDYFFREPKYDRGLLNWPSYAKASADAKALADKQAGKKNMPGEDTKKALTLVKETLEPIDWEIFDKDYIRKKLDDLAKDKFNGDRGAVYWPLRVALTGKQGSPDPVDLLGVLPKEIILKRIEKAIIE